MCRASDPFAVHLFGRMQCVIPARSVASTSGCPRRKQRWVDIEECCPGIDDPRSFLWTSETVGVRHGGTRLRFLSGRVEAIHDPDDSNKTGCWATEVVASMGGDVVAIVVGRAA